VRWCSWEENSKKGNRPLTDSWIGSREPKASMDCNLFAWQPRPPWPAQVTIEPAFQIRARTAHLYLLRDVFWFYNITTTTCCCVKKIDSTKKSASQKVFSGENFFLPRTFFKNFLQYTTKNNSSNFGRRRMRCREGLDPDRVAGVGILQLSIVVYTKK
jgi:hypothetical protein